MNEPIGIQVTICNRSGITISDLLMYTENSRALQRVQYSLDSGYTWNYLNQHYLLGTLEPGNCMQILIRGMVCDTEECFVWNSIRLFVGARTSNSWISVLQVPIG